MRIRVLALSDPLILVECLLMRLVRALSPPLALASLCNALPSMKGQHARRGIEDKNVLSRGRSLRDLNFDDLAGAIVEDKQAISLPPQCASAQGKEGDKFYAYQVRYSDCVGTWTICISQGSPMPLDLAVREIAQLPVGFRRFARSFIFGDASREPASHGYHWLLPDNDGNNRLGTGNAGTSAYTDADGNVHVQGWVKVEALLQLAIANALIVYADTKEWKAIVADDSCVATDFARQQETHALVSAVMLKMYQTLHGRMPDGLDYSCMDGQLKTVESLPIMGQALLGNTCDIPSVPGAVVKGAPAENIAKTTYATSYWQTQLAADETPSFTAATLSPTQSQPQTSAADVTHIPSSTATPGTQGGVQREPAPYLKSATAARLTSALTSGSQDSSDSTTTTSMDSTIEQSSAEGDRPIADDVTNYASPTFNSVAMTVKVSQDAPITTAVKTVASDGSHIYLVVTILDELAVSSADHRLSCVFWQPLLGLALTFLGHALSS